MLNYDYQKHIPRKISQLSEGVYTYYDLKNSCCPKTSNINIIREINPINKKTDIKAFYIHQKHIQHLFLKINSPESLSYRNYLLELPDLVNHLMNLIKTHFIEKRINELENKVKLLEDPENTPEKIAQRAIKATDKFKLPVKAEGFIYAIKLHGSQSFKTGKTKNLKLRLKQYRTSNPTAQYTYARETIDTNLAEITLQNILSHVATYDNREFFDVTDDGIIEIINKTVDFVNDLTNICINDVEKLRNMYINREIQCNSDLNIKQKSIMDYFLTPKISDNEDNEDIEDIEDDEDNEDIQDNKTTLSDIQSN